MTAEGMAPAQALRADPPAAEKSEARDRFAHVVGAAWRVAAAAGEKRRESDLVNTDQREGRPANHWLSSRRACQAGIGTPLRCDRRPRPVFPGAARPQRPPRRQACCAETTRERDAWRDFSRRRRPFFEWLLSPDAPAPPHVPW